MIDFMGGDDLSLAEKMLLVRAQGSIKDLPSNLRGNLSDGYHTFDELYDHRIRLFIALCRVVVAADKTAIGCGPLMEENATIVWCATKNSDGSEWPGWFILGIHTEPGKQITYHLPEKYWHEVIGFAKILPQASQWDGHTSEDVLERLKQLF